MTVLGYTYKAENYTPKALVAELVGSGVRAPGALGMSAEEVLDQWATENGIDRQDDWSFNSDDFPKTIDHFWFNVGSDVSFLNSDGIYVDANGNVVN